MLAKLSALNIAVHTQMFAILWAKHRIIAMDKTNHWWSKKKYVLKFDDSKKIKKKIERKTKIKSISGQMPWYFIAMHRYVVSVAINIERFRFCMFFFSFFKLKMKQKWEKKYQIYAILRNIVKICRSFTLIHGTVRIQ